MMVELEEIFTETISLREEIELAEMEGTDVKKSKIRVDRAEKLYKEAVEAMEKKDYMMVKAKTKAAKNMVEKAKELLEL